METLAYLHLAEDYENSEAKELNLKGLKSVALAGMIGAACIAGGVLGTADSASAHYYGGYYGGGYYGYRHYGYRHYYYPRYYNYRHYYRPCYY